MRYYLLKLCSLSRKLPLVKVGENTWIAYYSSLGDRKMIEACAQAMAQYFSTCDILMTTESKGIALAHSLAHILDHEYYVVTRKSPPLHDKEARRVRYRPVTSATEQEMYLAEEDAQRLRGRQVGLVDDVASTLATLRAMEELVRAVGGTVRCRGVMLTEGSCPQDIFSLGYLPVFTDRQISEDPRVLHS